MATNLTLILSALLFTFMLAALPIITLSDNTCPYPCYPTPTGTGTPSGGAPPPPPSSGSGSYPPPAGNYPTPTGNFPYYPSPPFGNNYNGPPPPDPILPYFPYYYRKPLHQTSDNSWASSSSISTLVIALANFFPFFFLF